MIDLRISDKIRVLSYDDLEDLKKEIISILGLIELVRDDHSIYREKRLISKFDDLYDYLRIRIDIFAEN